MTALQHNKLLGILHLAFGGLSVFLLLAICLLMLAMMGAMAATAPSDELFPVVFGVIMVFVVALNLVLVAPSFLAGYAFLKHKSWTKTIGLIAGIMATLSFPHGVALCVYTLWFLFGEHGKSLYDKAASALPPAPPVWARAAREQEREYVPPSTPPDWR